MAPGVPVYIVVCSLLVSESKLQLAAMAALFSLSLLLCFEELALLRLDKGSMKENRRVPLSSISSSFPPLSISSYPWWRWKTVGAQPLSRSKQALLFPLDKSELGRKGAELGQKAVKIGQIIWCWRAGSEKCYAQFFNWNAKYKIQIYTKYKYEVPWPEFCQNWTNHPMLLRRSERYNSSQNILASH